MKFIVKISKLIYHYANRKYLISVFVLFISLIIVMQIGPASSSALKELSGGMGMLDMQLGYSQQQVYHMLDTIGVKGRQLYSILLGIDFAFTIVFMVLQSLILSVLLRKTAEKDHFKILNMLPLVRCALDILENCFILALIFNYPVKIPLIVGISSTVTILKWTANTAIFVLIFLLGVLTAWRILDSKKKLKKVGGTI